MHAWTCVLAAYMSSYTFGVHGIAVMLHHTLCNANEPFLPYAEHTVMLI